MSTLQNNSSRFSLGPVTCGTIGSWSPATCGAELKSNQKMTGNSLDVCATVAPVGTGFLLNLREDSGVPLGW